MSNDTTMHQSSNEVEIAIEIIAYNNEKERDLLLT